MDYKNRIENAFNYIINKIPDKPQIGIILGTGLGSLADIIENPILINYKIGRASCRERV